MAEADIAQRAADASGSARVADDRPPGLAEAKPATMERQAAGRDRRSAAPAAARRRRPIPSEDHPGDARRRAAGGDLRADARSPRRHRSQARQPHPPGRRPCPTLLHPAACRRLQRLRGRDRGGAGGAGGRLGGDLGGAGDRWGREDGAGARGGAADAWRVSRTGRSWSTCWARRSRAMRGTR